jgi:hypothetical protein
MNAEPRISNPTQVGAGAGAARHASAKCPLSRFIFVVWDSVRGLLL